MMIAKPASISARTMRLSAWIVQQRIVATPATFRTCQAKPQGFHKDSVNAGSEPSQIFPGPWPSHGRLAPSHAVPWELTAH
eukprot:s1702_g6.t1